jgi:hypothetical protein
VALPADVVPAGVGPGDSKADCAARQRSAGQGTILNQEEPNVPKPASNWNDDNSLTRGSARAKSDGVSDEPKRGDRQSLNGWNWHRANRPRRSGSGSRSVSGTAPVPWPHCNPGTSVFSQRPSPAKRTARPTATTCGWRAARPSMMAPRHRSHTARNLALPFAGIQRAGRTECEDRVAARYPQFTNGRHWQVRELAVPPAKRAAKERMDHAPSKTPRSQFQKKPAR